jgi:hypothetical protein
MAQRNEHREQSVPLNTVRELRREVEALRRSLERNEERADSVAQRLVALEQGLGGECESKSCAPGPRPQKKAVERSLLLELAAESGVQNLVLAQLGNGEASVQIDGGTTFKLSTTLSALLAALAADNGKSDGDLVGWKAVSALIGTLQKALDREFNPHAIHQLVSRLRTTLAVKGGVNPFLVQTHRRHGLRFALRKQKGL